jgi:hypothetical protein
MWQPFLINMDREIFAAHWVRRILRRHLSKTRFLIATIGYVRMLASCATMFLFFGEQ